MSTTASVSIPTAREVEDHAKSILAVSAIVGGAWALCSRWHRRRQAARRRRALEAKAVRYTLDAIRHVLHVLQPGGSRNRLINLNELARQLALVSDVREELWVADGNPSRRDTERLESEIVKVLTRTQAIQAIRAQQQTQDMFADPGGGGEQ